MNRVTIGLEIHAELKTKRKMFCFCANNPHTSAPNTHICPVCMAQPGALPVINKEAIRHMLKIGLALNGQLSTEYTEFDRKSYFYPDMPKAYQISQYKYPIVSGGELLGVKITRVHLEEDTARSQHDKASENTKIDFNRSGVPLMELVTEPVVSDAKQAMEFAKELQRVLRILKVSDANMEKGEMRVEANISIPNDDGSFGTKVEVKNLNSFKSVYGAIEYEIKRQTALREQGVRVLQETRGWDENKQETFSQRLKETAADYKYFPDPDLPKLVLKDISEFDLDLLRKELPELPSQIRNRLEILGIGIDKIDFYVDNPKYLSVLDAAVAEIGAGNAKIISNYISSDLIAVFADNLPDSVHKSFSTLLRYLVEDKISSRVVKDLIVELKKDPELDIKKFLDTNSLWQVNDTKLLTEIVNEILNSNPDIVADYKSGKDKALAALIGLSMKALKEKNISANPRLLTDILKRTI